MPVSQFNCRAARAVAQPRQNEDTGISPRPANADCPGAGAPQQKQTSVPRRCHAVEGLPPAPRQMPRRPLRQRLLHRQPLPWAGAFDIFAQAALAVRVRQQLQQLRPAVLVAVSTPQSATAELAPAFFDWSCLQQHWSAAPLQDPCNRQPVQHVQFFLAFGEHTRDVVALPRQALGGAAAAGGDLVEPTIAYLARAMAQADSALPCGLLLALQLWEGKGGLLAPEPQAAQSCLRLLQRRDPQAFVEAVVAFSQRVWELEGGLCRLAPLLAWLGRQPTMGAQLRRQLDACPQESALLAALQAQLA